MKQFFAFIAFTFSVLGSAQTATTLPTSGTVVLTDCSGILHDDGGPNGSYSNNVYVYAVIQAGASDTVQLTFSQFQLESGYDYLRIYTGDVSTGPISQIYSYTGSAIPTPNITTPGPITIRFSSDYIVTGTGFTLTYSYTSTSPPSATVTSSSTIAYNTPHTFNAVRTGSTSGQWVFSDGTTVSGNSATRNLKQPGLDTAYFYAFGCDPNLIDTVMHIYTVEPEPQATLSPDTLFFSTDCFTSVHDTLFASNATGAGTLNLSWSIIDPNPAEWFDFEQPAHPDLSLGFGHSVTTTEAAVGNSSLEVYSNNTSYIYFDDEQYSSLSYYTKRDAGTSNAAEVGFYDNDYHTLFGMFRWSSTGYQMFYYDVNNAYNSQVLAYSPSQWLHVELRNIDWVQKTYDIYLNGEFHDAARFWSTSTVAANDGLFYMYVTSDYLNRGYLDHVEVFSSNVASGLSYAVASTQLPGGGSNSYIFTFDPSGFPSGTYGLALDLVSNDNAWNGASIPVQVTIEGVPGFATYLDTVVFDPAVPGRSYSVWDSITNVGCALFAPDSIVSTNPDYSWSSLTQLGQDSTAGLEITFTGSTLGVRYDSLIFYHGDTTFYLFLESNTIYAPALSLVDTIYQSVVGCFDSLTVPFTLYNVGLDTLDWQQQNYAEVLSDDIEGSVPAFWDYFGTRTSSCGPLDGFASVRFSFSNNFLTTQPLDFSSGGSVAFDIAPSPSGCFTPTNIAGHQIRAAYSVNGGPWIDFGPAVYPSAQFRFTATLPSAAHSPNTAIKIYTSSYLNGYWVLDNFAFSLNRPSQLQPTMGAILPGDSADVNAIIYTGNLEEGTHYKGFAIATNDPDVPTKQVVVALTIDGLGELVASPNACAVLDTAFQYTTVSDSMLIFNEGCAPLVVSSLSTDNNDLQASLNSYSLNPGDSTYLTFTRTNSTLGAFQDSIFVTHGDGVNGFCVSGYVVLPPALWVDSTAISLSAACGSAVTFNLPIANPGDATLSWSVAEGVPVNALVITTYTYPALMPNFYTMLESVGNVTIKTASTAAAIQSELAWADVVIVPPASGNVTSSFFASIASSLDTYINNGGQLLLMGSLNIGTVLTGFNTFMNASYYANYSNSYIYNQSGMANHPFIAGVASGYIAQLQAFAIQNNTANTSIIQRSSWSWSHILTSSNLGSGRIIYSGYNLMTIQPQVQRIYTNILEDIRAAKNQPTGWLSFVPTSGTILNGDSTTLSVTATTAGLSAGVHTLNAVFTSNDPLDSVQSVPITLTVIGEGDSWMASNCMNFGSVYQNLTYADSSMLVNTGCDTLFVSSAATFTSDFTAGTPPSYVLPGDTGWVPVTLLKSTPGAVSDSVAIYTNVDTVYRCLTATILQAPVCSVTPTALNITLNKCNTFTTVPITIQNTGQANLGFSDIRIQDTYDSTSVKYWGTYSTSNTHTFYNVMDMDTLFFEITINGGYQQSNNYFYIYFNGNSQGIFYDNNVANGTNDVITGYVTGTALQDIYNDANANGDITVWVYRYNYTYNLGTQLCQVRLFGSKQSTWATPVGATTGTLIPNQQVNKNILISAANLPVGQYASQVEVVSNDPGTPVVSIPLNLNVVNLPDMNLSSSNVAMGTVYGTTPVRDSIYIENLGCTDLIITGINSSNGKFVPDWTAQTIFPGTTVWLPWTFTPTQAGVETSAFTFISNDTASALSISANVVFPAVADYQYSVVNPCTGMVNFTNESANGSSYFWAFGDGQFSTNTSPIHVYDRPGIYDVMLVASNSGSTDTIYKTVDMSNVLYVAASFPDTVQAGVPVQFVDSSLVANSWSWFFGDGNNDNNQNPTHTYANKGTFIVSLQVTNAAGCTASDNSAIVVTSGIGLDEEFADLVVYPNPTQGLLQIDGVPTATGIEIYNAAGVLVAEMPFTDRLDISDLPAGSYQLVIRGEKGSTRVAIQRVR